MGAVEPAASLPIWAMQAGATIAFLNLDVRPQASPKLYRLNGQRACCCPPSWTLPGLRAHRRSTGACAVPTMTMPTTFDVTHTTALVIVPPTSCWPLIQALRERFDPKARRWMPHITLVYPFVPRAAWDEVRPILAAVCRTIEPFSLTLGSIGVFPQRGGRAVLWFAPEPTAPLAALHAALAAALPLAQAHAPSRFTPHLSIGRAATSQERETLAEAVRATWVPVTFSVREIALVWRNAPPDDVFRVGERLPLREI